MWACREHRRRSGGGNGRENRVTLCAWHHLRGIHAGRVRAWGEAPAGLTWEIGVRTGQRALIRVDAHGYDSHLANDPSAS